MKDRVNFPNSRGKMGYLHRRSNSLIKSWFIAEQIEILSAVGHNEVSNCIDGVVKLVLPVAKEWQTSNTEKHQVRIDVKCRKTSEWWGGGSWQISLYPGWP